MSVLPSRMSRVSRIFVALAGTAGLLASLSVAPAMSADTVAVSPPGANDFSCKPSVAHPSPVVLVNGTFEGMAKNWVTMSPYLVSRGYCVFAFDYGTTNGVPATGPIATSAQELKTFVTKVLTRRRSIWSATAKAG